MINSDIKPKPTLEMKHLLLFTLFAVDGLKTQKLLGALTRERSPTTGAEVIELLAQFYGGLNGVELKQSNEITINGDISGNQNILMNGDNLGTINQTIYNIYKGSKRGGRKLRREIEVILRNANDVVDSNKRKLTTDDILDMIEDLVNNEQTMMNDAIPWTASPEEVEEQEPTESVPPRNLEQPSQTDEEYQSFVPFAHEVTICPRCQIINGQIDCRMSSDDVVCRHDQVCSLNMRSRGGHLVKVETQCKEPSTCAIEQSQNGNGNQWNQCRPRSGFHISSLCRQCCRGDCKSKLSTLKTNWYRLKEWNTNLMN